MRTSLACIALGVGFYAILSQVDPEWLPRAVATSFLLMAILAIFHRTPRVSRHRPARFSNFHNRRRINLRLFTVIICLGATGLVFVVWLMNPD